LFCGNIADANIVSYPNLAKYFFELLKFRPKSRLMLSVVSFVTLAGNGLQICDVACLVAVFFILQPMFI
jgi:hypothetical protein